MSEDTKTKSGGAVLEQIKSQITETLSTLLTQSCRMLGSSFTNQRLLADCT